MAGDVVWAKGHVVAVRMPESMMKKSIRSSRFNVNPSLYFPAREGFSTCLT